MADTWGLLFWFDEVASHALYLVAHFVYLALIAAASDLAVQAPVATLAVAAWHGAIIAVLCLEAGMPLAGFAGATLVALAMASRRSPGSWRSDIAAAFAGSVAVACVTTLVFYFVRVGSFIEPYDGFGSIGQMVLKVFFFQ